MAGNVRPWGFIGVLLASGIIIRLEFGLARGRGPVFGLARGFGVGLVLGGVAAVAVDIVLAAGRLSGLVLDSGLDPDVVLGFMLGVIIVLGLVLCIGLPIVCCWYVAWCCDWVMCCDCSCAWSCSWFSRLLLGLPVVFIFDAFLVIVLVLLLCMVLF